MDTISSGLIPETVSKSQRNEIGLTDFKRLVYRRYQHAHHLEVFDQHLTEVARYIETGGKEGIAFLISEMPPRHGKTFTLGRFFPTWFLGRNPDCRVMLVSYGQDLVDKPSRQCRSLITSPVFQEIYTDVKLAPESRAVNAWNIHDHEGGMDAIGIKGGATGKGAHLLICDDLIKDRKEAESDLIRENTWEALVDDLLTRLEPGGAVVLNATRWHLDDPIGRAIKNLKPIYGNKMVRLRFPAIAEKDDILGRAEGEALWSERYPIDDLRLKEATMGAYSWSALYQQSPVPAEGGIFKRAWFEPLRNNCPEIVYAYRYWDLAMSEKTSADYTAGVKIGQAVDGHWYILDVAHKRVDWGDLTAYLAEIILADGAGVQQGIEKKGYMSRAIQDLNNDPRLRGYAIFGYDVDTDKTTRALPFAAKCGAGLVHVLNESWAQEYVDELCSFPNGMHDDQVDASSGAWAMTALGDALASVGVDGYAPMQGSF